MNEVIGRCPVCSEKMVVTRLECPQCGTAIEGKFELCKFCYLSKEQRDFLELFIRTRGNIREMEKELGLSYPTIRNKLDNLIAALGYEVERRPTVDKKEVLKKLESGEITVQEALKLLKE
ncbi:hypothetical protein SAMN04244560_01555 [Thermoanaerobacter thermohydrosulfuricus]|uniref:DUF2089 domain-containing protein n=5 Tax=Thermoanaerobacter TaxID=1754 RepID=I9AFR5_9THEO|nr:MULTISPECIES: DUF2089 domain-containing protein [Thermoanaerobacter]AEX55355.1 hypothetical protein [Thermoanaerobacter ethanolicus JW 200]MBE3592842.1 DUF2089 domain-containing protein [Thermoanaerobacter sp.]AEM79023.1 Protein of unknown function DUF2089 [Thermoanaerobacter wiegelii Rt8.B1]EGD51797.1 Protein of unknown function DUF2089 [Thermoanaerobacter ethanolicus JW 200]EIW00862.1 hypothetical protein ThesiDRAFT1_1989 [Thermoanaerobacter siderophilus SR4]